MEAPQVLSLRPDQAKVFDEVREKIRHGARRIAVVCPTGSGKGVMLAEMLRMAHERGGKGLVLTERREIALGAHKKLGKVGVDAGLIMAGHVANRELPVQVASIQSLVNRANPEAKVVIADECHHGTAATWRGVFDQYPDAIIVGFTATPQRSDGVGLGEVFDEMAVGPSVAELTELRRLAPCDFFAPDGPGNGALAMDPIEAWLKFSGDRPGFVFAKNVDHSKEITEGLRLKGVRAEHVDANTPKRIRDEIVEGFEQMRIDVLSSVNVFTEGVDLPRAKCFMLARGVSNVGSYMQMGGRVLRVHSNFDTAVGIDLVGAVHEFGFLDEHRQWDLEGKGIKDSILVPAVHRCPACAAVFPPRKDRICIRCGAMLPKPPRPEVKRRQVRKQKRKPWKGASEEKKRELYESLRKKQRENNYKQGWVFWKYRSVFGEAPDPRWR